MMREMMRKTEKKSISTDTKIEKMRLMRHNDILRNKEAKRLREQDREEIMQIQKNQQL